MDLRRLKYFVAVAEQGSFRGAADRLHIAQSALSRRIQELEVEIGQELFDRTGGRLRLLPAGDVLLGHARAILKAVDDAARQMASHADGQIGLLRLGMTAMSGQIGFVARAIRQFRDAHPRVGVDLQLLVASKEIVESVRNGALDAAIVYGDAEWDGCDWRTLRQYQPYFAVPAGHPLAGREAIAVGELAGEDLILFSRALDPVRYDTLIASFVRAGITPNIIHELPSEDVRLALVRAGLGVTLVSGSIFERGAPAGIIALPARDLDLDRNLNVLWRADHQSPALLALVSAFETAAAQGLR